MSGRRISIRQGDTTAAIAASHGLFPETVWQHPENEELRTLRKDPNILRAGDQLFVPDKRAKAEDCATGTKHVFVRKGVPEKLRIQCLDWEGGPRAKTAYRVTLDDRQRRDGTTDSLGWIDCWVPPSAKSATIQLGPEDDVVEEFEVLLGHLDPVEFCTGVSDRLRNLGYYEGPSLEEPNEELWRAIARFREDEDLPDSDEIDDDTRTALARRHGS